MKNKRKVNNGFMHLSKECSGNFPKLVKQKRICLYKYIDSFKKCSDDKSPDRSKLFSSLKDECISGKDFCKPMINVYDKTIDDLSCPYPYEYMQSFKEFFDNKLPDRCEFFSSFKDKCIREKDFR